MEITGSNNHLIYDVGMNNGDDTAYYLFKGYQVIAIEADPLLCANASVRFQSAIQSGQLQILNIGIAPTPGQLDFWICDGNSIWSSFQESSVMQRGLPYHSVKVECQTFDAVLKKYGVPFYLKIDIEGFDYLCVDSLLLFPVKPKFVSCELSDIENTLESLSASGYTKFKLIYQGALIPLEIPASKEQRFYEFYNGLFMRLIRKIIRVLQFDRLFTWGYRRLTRNPKWDFSIGSSGPFGNDILGRWLNHDEVLHTYHVFKSRIAEKRIIALFRSNFYNNWVDLHASRE